MNVIKTRTRNKMGTTLLGSILTIKSGLRRSNTCCLKYQFPPDVLKKIGTLQTYNSTSNPNLVASTSNVPNTTNYDLDLEYQEDDPNDPDELWIL